MQYGRVVPLFFPFEDEPCSTESWKVHPVDAKINYDYDALTTIIESMEGRFN